VVPTIRRRFVATAVAVLTVLSAAGTAPPVAHAAASPPRADAAEPVLQIRSTSDSLVAPATAAPGPATFHASTSAEGSGWVGLARLHEGVTWAEFRAALQDTISTDAAAIVRGSRELRARAELLGGVVISPGRDGRFTQVLRPGTYLLFDYLDVISAPAPRYRWLTVSGAPAGQALTPTATLVSSWVAGTGPRFHLTGTVRAGQPLTFVNGMSGQFNEAIFFRLADDVAEPELEAYFQRFSDSGQWPDEDPPFAEQQGFGCLPLSPGQLSVIQGPLRTGRYVVVNWLKDATDGGIFAKKGHYKIIQVQ